MEAYITVAGIEDLQPGTMKSVREGGKSILLVNVDGEVHALLWITSGNGYGYLKGYTDGSNPPTTMRAATLEEEEAPGRIKRSIRFSVRKGDYWKVDMYAPGGGIKKVYWLPEGN